MADQQLHHPGGKTIITTIVGYLNNQLPDNVQIGFWEDPARFQTLDLDNHRIYKSRIRFESKLVGPLFISVDNQVDEDIQVLLNITEYGQDEDNTNWYVQILFQDRTDGVILNEGIFSSERNLNLKGSYHIIG